MAMIWSEPLKIIFLGIIWEINHFVWTSQCVSRTEYGYKLLARVPWQMNDQSHKIAFAIWRIWLDFDKSMIKNVYLSQYFLSS